MDSSKIAIKSNHIYLSSQGSFSGYLLIHDELIYDAVPSLNEVQLDIYFILDYTDFYVMPGMIDLNVHLNSAFYEDWKDIENITKLAAKGGITTILDNPIMNHIDENMDEIENIKLRENNLKSKLYVDCGLLAYLSPENFLIYQEIFDNTQVFGFKIYLSQSLEYQLPYMKKTEFKEFLSMIEKYTSDSKLILVINSELCSERDLFMSSPCRKSTLNQRLDLNFDIKDFSKFGGGFHGEIVNSGELGFFEKNQIKEKKEMKSPEIDINILSNTTRGSPTTTYLSHKSKINTLDIEIKQISYLEYIEYEQTNSSAYRKESLLQKKGSLYDGFDSELDDNEKHSENELENILLAENLKLNLRFNSCLSFDREESEGNPLNNVFKNAIKQISSENNIKIHSSPHSENNSNSKRSFGERRKTFTDSKNSSFKLQKIKIEKQLEGQKEKQKNQKYIYFLTNHPTNWESNGISMTLRLLNFTLSEKISIVFSNLSNASLAFQIKDYKKFYPKSKIYAETSTPYIYFNNDMIKDGETKYKNSPPIRDKENQTLMSFLIKKGLFDIITSFNMFVPKSFKEVDDCSFRRAFSGFSSIGVNLQVVWSKLYSMEKYEYKKLKKYGENQYLEHIENIFFKLIRMLCENPSKIMNIDMIKGNLLTGKRADLFIWNPFKVMKIDEEKDVFSSNKNLYLFNNYKMYGEIMLTMLGGEIIYKKSNENHIFPLRKGIVMRNNTNFK